MLAVDGRVEFLLLIGEALRRIFSIFIIVFSPETLLVIAHYLVGIILSRFKTKSANYLSTFLIIYILCWASAQHR